MTRLLPGIARVLASACMVAAAGIVALPLGSDAVAGVRLDDIVIEVAKGPATAATPAPSLEEPLSDVIWILARVPQHEHALLVVRARLRAGAVALKEEKELLKDLRETLALSDPDSPHRAGREQWAREIEATIAKLEQEREDLLEEATSRWEQLRLDLDDIIRSRRDDKAIQRDLMGFRDQLQQREDLSDLEMLLAAGKSQELRAKLPSALRNPAIAERAAEIRVSDLLERGRMAEALHASRLGLDKYPENPTFGLFVQDLEQSYLKAISQRTVDDGERLRRTWDEYVAGAEDSYAWQAFFGGLKRSYHRVTGKAAKLEALAKSGFDRAAMEHNGIELMLRLRKQGLSLDQIEALDQEALRGWLIRIAPKRGPPSDEIVEDFTVAIAAALRNPDVRRLRTTGPTPMRLAEKSYYGAEEFEAGWGEWALDCISAKNVLLIFGPAARLGSIPGNLARLAGRLGQGSRATAAFSGDAAALTIGEWFYSTNAAQGLASAVADSRAGQVLYQARHVLRELRYHDKFLVRAATATSGFATQVAGHWLLMEGAGTVGEKLGGETGRIAGELAAGLVGLPGTGSTARLQARMERAQAVMAQARARAQVTEAVLKTLRAPVHEAAETLASQGGRLAASQRRTLQNVLEAADEAAAAARTAAASFNGSPLLNSSADEAEALAASARASLAGRAEDALGASQIGRTLQAETEELGRTLAAGERQMGQALAEAAEASPGATLKAQRPPRAPGAAPSLTGDPLPPPPKLRIGDPVPEVVPPTPRPAANASVAELEEAAEAAMRANRFDDAAALLHTASRHAEVTPEAGARIRAALNEARSAAKTHQVLARRSTLPRVAELAEQADKAKLPFDDAQRAVLKTVKKLDDMTPLAGAGGARRIDAPDGTPLAVWKPGKRATAGVLEDDGQVVAEVLMSRLGRRLGLNVPYAEPMVVDGVHGVVIRWIPNTTELASLNAGSRAALKGQVALFKPLHTLLGNYDGHMGNFKVDRAGRIWAVDAGQSILHTPLDPIPPSYHPLPGRNATFNWTRHFRDWYAKVGRQTYSRMQDLITGAEMNRPAEALRRLTRDEIQDLVEQAMRGAPASRDDMGKVVATLYERQRELPELLDELWQGALP